MTEKSRLPSASGDGIQLQRFEDVIFPDLAAVDPARGIRYTRELPYRSGDILMCSYNKCGTHWVGNAIWKLKTIDDTGRPEDTLLEFGPPEVYDTMAPPRIIITHQKPSRLPVEHVQNGGAIVLVLRNPKDVMVSYYHHLKNAVVYKNPQTWNEFFETFMAGQVPFGSYFDYVQQWEEFLNENANDVNVHIVYYEDLIANPRYCFSRLNKFLGFNRDCSYVDKVVEITSFSSLKELDKSRTDKTHKAVLDKSGVSVIYRKGIVGDWRNYLTLTQSEAVDTVMKERLKHGIIHLRYQI